VRDALRKLGSHALFRREVARTVGELMLASEGPRALDAVGELLRLDDPDARAYLAWARDHRDPDVRARVSEASGPSQP